VLTTSHKDKGRLIAAFFMAALFTGFSAMLAMIAILQKPSPMQPENLLP